MEQAAPLLAALTRAHEHTLWGNHRVLEVLRAQAPVPAPALHLFAHLLAAEEVWLRRLRRKDTQALTIWPTWNLEVCAERLRHNGAEYGGFLHDLTDDHLTEIVTYRNSQGTAFQTAVGDMLHHVFSHGAYHRGQIALLLRQAGLEPVNTDFITFVREGH